MGGVVIFWLLNNILIFSIIFWLLTWVGEYFYKKKNQTSKKKFYECGFKSINDINIQINLNFSILCVFLILYDVEFIFILPAVMNIMFFSLTNYILLCVFIYLIIISLIYDIQMNAMNWQN